MITVSLCMIVKNEEAVLARCLDSLAGLMDEIIIVDTGSTDNTKAIARRYTELVYDFTWCDDFSAARNFSFEKASMDYIYAPDADEVLDEENRRQFGFLKEAMLPEIEIVQMWYRTPDEHNTVQNFSRELRPKLFKRLRTFTWIDPIHETVRLEPIVFDSDIEILHLPPQNNSKRDFSIYEKAIARDGSLSCRILSMYAKELLKQGTARDFETALPYFEKLRAAEWEAAGDLQADLPETGCTDNARIPEIDCVLARGYRLLKDDDRFLKLCMEPGSEKYAEICRELGFYHLEKEDDDEALSWFLRAADDTMSEAALDITVRGSDVLAAISDCYLHLAKNAADPDKKSLLEHATEYRRQAEAWTLPDPDGMNIC